MNAALREGLRLRAIRQNFEPIRIRLERGIPIHRDALLWTSVSLPGDQSQPLGVLLGSPRETPDFIACDAARGREALVLFFAAICEKIERHIDRSDSFFQLVVSDTADVRHLVSTALRAGKIGPSDPWDDTVRKRDGRHYDPLVIARARRLAFLLAHLAIVRYAQSYQAGLVVLTDVLADHVATAISDQERQHLGIHLAYASPGLSYADRQAAAARTIKFPSDHRLLGAYDDDITRALQELRDPNLSPAEKLRKTPAYHDLLIRILRDLRAQQETALDLLSSFPDGGPAANYLSSVESENFTHFRARHESLKTECCYTDPKSDRKMLVNPIRSLTDRRGVTTSIRAFVRQEHFFEAADAAMIRKDPIVRASAILDGKVVRTRVTRVEIVGRSTLLYLATKQEIAEFEVGDDVEILDWPTHDPRGEFLSAEGTIKDVALQGAVVAYTLRIGRSVSLPVGAVLELASKVFASAQIFEVSERRLMKTPWTHSDETALPPVAIHAHQNDRVADLFNRL